jgi:signal transduction histidine kinase
MDNEQLEGVQIIIRDNGSGIPESVMSHLFEPFNSSKASGHSGLGLSVVYHIIQQLSGSVECESTRENGTSFTIYLPLSCKAQPNQE